MSFAVVSDAGTPGISDPGMQLAQMCHDAGVTQDLLSATTRPLSCPCFSIPLRSVCLAVAAAHQSQDPHRHLWYPTNFYSYRLIFSPPQIPVRPVPGACAAAAGISVSGMGSGEFLFKGFLPAKGKERKEAIERVCSCDCAVVLYESPHRIVDTLKDIAKVSKFTLL